jgi:acyl-CoA thioesterase-1
MPDRKYGLLFLVLFYICFSTPAVLYAETTVLILGDSLTEGTGVEKTKAYPYLVEQKLKAQGFLTIKVINGGVSGSTTASALSRLKWYLRDRPDILLLALGANDGLRGLPTLQIKHNLAETIKLSLSKGIRVVLAGMRMPPNYGKDYTLQFEKVFHELAKEYDIAFIPFLLKGVAGDPQLNLSDGIHPNEPGHQIIAQLVYETLVNLVKTPPSH